MQREDTYALLLLAGGKNARMKANKAELLFEGKTFAEQIISKARALGITQIYLAGAPSDREETEAHFVPDLYPNRGPLGGMQAGMKAIRTPFCLVLPIDVPKLPADVLEALLTYHAASRSGLRGSGEIPLLWEHGDRTEPLIGIYPTSMADVIEAYIKERSVPVFRVLDVSGYEVVRREVPPQTIINVNTPELYRQLIGRGEKGPVPIQKIRDGGRYEAEDEVAFEYRTGFHLKDGSYIRVVCTPSYVDELILGRRFLLDDLTPGEIRPAPGQAPLKKMHQSDLFRIAHEMFEHPGRLFQDTGCAHSCVLVRNNTVVISMEDIGRHNALDKVIGYALKNRIPLTECAVFCSGRVSADYLQKAVTAGIRLVVSRAAVTESAVSLAGHAGITLLGFVRKGSGNLYHEGSVIIES